MYSKGTLSSITTYLFPIFISILFSYPSTGKEPDKKTLFWMHNAQKSMSQVAWRKLPAIIRPLIDAPKAHLKMHGQFMELRELDGEDPIIGLLIQSHGTREELEALGGQIGAQIGDIFSVRIPISRLKDLAELSNVMGIQPSLIHKHHLDASIADCQADLVHQGNYAATPPIYSGYTGEGVLVGALDTGIDWNHDDFINDSNGSSRILYIWDQTIAATGNDKSPANFCYGVEYTKAQIDNELDGTTVAAIRTKDDIGHGSHVMGIIAGDGSATGSSLPAYTYVGMAPEADILMVRGTNLDIGDTGFTETEELDAIAYAAAKADALGKPLSFNMSLGGQWGPHDGTSLTEQAIDQIVETGKVIVISAGNEGTNTTFAEYIHAEGTVSTGTEVSVEFEVPSSYNYGAGDDFIALTLWYQGNDQIRVTVTTPDGHSWYADTGSDRNATYAYTDDGAIYIDNASGGMDLYNGDRECYIEIWDDESYYPPESGTWRVTVKGNTIAESGHFDCWIPVSQIGSDYAYFTSSSGSNEEIVGSPGAADKAITVAAYSTKNSWISYSGNNESYSSAVLHDLAYFSSAGPTRDDPGYVTGRQKPEIAGSGFCVVSALSADAASYMTSYRRNQDYVHVIMSGTSMSAPHITGCVALMLSKNPTLTPGEVKQILQSSARSDSYTGSVPNYLWGYGKMDAYSAVSNTPASPLYYISITPSRKEIGGAEGSIVTCPFMVNNNGQNSDSYNLSVSNSWTTTLWDSNGTAEISSISNLGAGSSYQILVKVNVPSGANFGMKDSTVITATSVGNSSQSGNAKVVAMSLGNSGSLPWSDTFPSPSLNATKWVTNSGPATVNTMGIGEPSGSYSLNLDGDTKGGDEVRSQPIDLSGYSNVSLGYYYQRTGGGDSPEEGDNLMVSYSNHTGDWMGLNNHPGGGSDMSTYTYEEVLLPEDACHENFQIRFHNIATAGNFDDWFIDDVVLKIPADISVTPDNFVVATSPELTATRNLTISNIGNSDLNYTIYTQYLGSSMTAGSSKGKNPMEASRQLLSKYSLEEIRQKTVDRRKRVMEKHEERMKIGNQPSVIQSGNVIYVDGNSTSPVEDGSVENPYKTITDGVFYAYEGDTVVVAQGIYYEENIAIYYGITIKGNGAIIQGTGLENWNDGLSLFCGNITIVNLIITNCQWGIFMYSGGGPIEIKNCTIYNHGNSGIVVWPLSGDEVTVMNNVIAFAGVIGISYWDGILNNSYNDVYGHSEDWSDCTQGTGSISQDPLFVNAAGHDFTLQAGSPCIDAGNPAFQYIDQDGTRNDMGAFGGPEIGSSSIVAGWLSYDVTSGTIAPGGSQDVYLTCDPSGLNASTVYRAKTVISSNDPDDPLVEIPIRFEIGSLPYQVTLSPESQNKSAAARDTAVYTLTVKNVGSNSDTYNLNVTGNTWPTTIWNGSQTSQITSVGPLAPDSEEDIVVVVDVPSTASSGDTDEATVGAVSTANSSIFDEAMLITIATYVPAEISVVPDSFLVTTYSNVIATGNLNISNIGNDDLNYGISTEYLGSTEIAATSIHALSVTDRKQSTSFVSPEAEKQRILKKNNLEKARYEKTARFKNNSPSDVSTGDVIYVDVNSTSPIEDGSEENPYKTIFAGVYNAFNGDTIIVTQGIYYEEEIDIEKSLTLKGNGAIVIGTGLNTDNSIFTVSGGASNVMIMNFVLTNGDRGIFIYSTTLGPVSLYNNTIAYNGGSGVVVFPDEEITLMNNIIAFNGTFGIAYFDGALSNSYNDVYSHLEDWHDCTQGAGSISQDPLFADAAANDFTLQSGSPCIDAGNPAVQYNDGDGTRNDMGAFGGPEIGSSSVVAGWLSYDVTSGTIVPGASQNVVLTCDPFGLNAGTVYQAKTVISSNDPDAPVVEIPIRFEISVLLYQVALTPESQDGSAASGDTVVYTLTVKNTGFNSDTYNLGVSGNNWPTTIWNDEQTDQIESVGPLASNDSADIKLLVMVPETAVSGETDTGTISASSVDSPPGSNSAAVTTTAVNILPWFEDFPTTTLDTEKWAVINGSPEINSESDNEPSPPYALELNNGSSVESETINLSRFSNRDIYLDFWWQNKNTGSGEDLVVKIFDGSYWIVVSGIPGETNQEITFTGHSLPIPDYALNENFKFQFESKNISSISEWFIDDVTIHDLTDVKNQLAATLPSSFELGQNYPNPFNPETLIHYAIPKACQVKIQIFNTQGRLIATLIDGQKQAGRYSIQWNGRDMFDQTIASGVYFYRIVAGDFVKVRKLMLLK